MPVRSSGCALCRKRKIRCDEKRPSCDRCKTHGVTCPGYRDPPPGQIQFKDETRTTAQAVRQKRSGKKDTVKDVAILPTKCIGKATKEWQQQVYPSPPDSAERSLSSTPMDWVAPLDGEAFYAHEQLMNHVGLRREECPLDFANAMAFYAAPSFLPSPAVEKSMIYSTFIDVYLPKRTSAGGSGGAPYGSRDAHFSFLQRLLQTPNLRSEVSDSLDALSMVQVGSLYKDQGLLRHSVKAYSKALNGLLRTLSRSDFIQDDHVLATVTILATCEFFDEIAQMGEGWSAHIEGSAQLLEARGPDAVQSEMGLLIYSNMRHGALSHALLARKGTFMGTPEWRAVAYRAPIVDSSTRFYDVALQIPGVLERYDNLDFTSPHLLGPLTALMDEASRLEKEMRVWFAAFEKQFRLVNQYVYQRVPIEDFAAFCGLVESRYIEEAFMFPSFLVAYATSTYWDTMHFLRTTIKRMHRDRHDADPSWFPADEETVLEPELMEYVMNMCRSFPYMCEPTSSSTGQIGLFLPMRTTAVYCTEQGHWQLLKWVGEVRNSVFNRGMRPPSVRDKMLNRPPLPMFVATRPSNWRTTASPTANAASPDCDSVFENMADWLGKYPMSNTTMPNHEDPLISFAREKG